MTKSTTRSVRAVGVAAAIALGLAGCVGLPLPQGPANEAPASEAPALESVESSAPSDAAVDQSAALVALVAEAQAQVPATLAQFADTYSDFQVLAVPPDTLEYAYYYLEPTDLSLAAAYLDEQIPALQAIADSAVLPEMVAYGVTVDPKVRYTYYNSDGSLIWTHTFEAS